jgi:hypothetical protein
MNDHLHNNIDDDDFRTAVTNWTNIDTDIESSSGGGGGDHISIGLINQQQPMGPITGDTVQVQVPFWDEVANLDNSMKTIRTGGYKIRQIYNQIAQANPELEIELSKQLRVIVEETNNCAKITKDTLDRFEQDNQSWQVTGDGQSNSDLWYVVLKQIFFFKIKNYIKFRNLLTYILFFLNSMLYRQCPYK